MTTTLEKTTPRERPRVLPRTDVLENEDAVVLIADMPGVGEDSIEVTLTEDVLTLRGRPAEPSSDGWTLESAEFELPDYERTFRLATEIETEKIAAVIQNGCLRVTLPKRRPRKNRIEVRPA